MRIHPIYSGGLVTGESHVCGSIRTNKVLAWVSMKVSWITNLWFQFLMVCSQESSFFFQVIPFCPLNPYPRSTHRPPASRYSSRLAYAAVELHPYHWFSVVRMGFYFGLCEKLVKIKSNKYSICRVILKSEKILPTPLRSTRRRNKA